MKTSCILCIALVLVSLCHAYEFVSPSQPPVSSPTTAPSNTDCSTVIYSMLDCLSFLSVGSTALSPTKPCCDGVETVLDYNPNCLCVGLESSREMGIELINSRALAMPSICNIHINPHCDVASSPTASTPAASTISSPAKPPMTSSSSTSSPAITTPPPTVPPSIPLVTHSSSAIIASSPAIAAPSSAITAPSPSKSSTGNLIVSKLFLAAVIVSSFASILS
ncbi:hypothetical protein EUTSA_v10004887mg [Eutrema salsugineum]|uniref:Bifunctional inhibitor/plant lipid transfer protein/seed storage helical domain-containing protein n=1 Tax=Eutrema salsugineum TaxID=72664 RepID=V4MNX3_EUTSA|nr:non-specific lipid-transfer protein-like protein At2g13820 [Eutrema salsugineum]ESQ33316.1 hypothetical protein EUTSA_v10004887mg [Eutrema salsugineum]